MERNKRRFKRTIKHETFKEELKRQMNINNFKRKKYIPFEKELKIEVYRRCDLAKTIRGLPKEIQKKIYIETMRNYWKYTAMNTIYKPMYYDYLSYMEKEKAKVYYDNIHFLHLPFNTLPENKKWIMGCQCDFCINDNNIDPILKHMHYLTQYRNNNYFTEVFMPSENSSKWNEYLYPINDNDDTQYMKIFDPLCGSYKENKFTKRLREGYQFEFSYPI